MSTYQAAGIYAGHPQWCACCAKVHVPGQPDRLRLRLVVTDAELKQRFGFAIRVALANKGWKPPDLARALGVDPSTADRWASGESVPSLLLVPALSQNLDVPPDYLYEPKEVPDYPISLEGLIRRASAEGTEEGLKQRPPQRRRKATPPEGDAGSAA